MKIFIPEKVVFSLESDEQVGTIHNLQNGEKAYLNGDMIKIIRHLIQGRSLGSFFSKKIPRKKRDRFVFQSESIIRQLLSVNLLEKEKPECQGLIKKIKADPPLRVVFLELTKKCNLSCMHCYVYGGNSSASSHQKQITFAKICDLIAEIDDLGVMELQLTEGEIFVLPYALDILKEVQRRLISCSVFTNGTLMTKSVLRYVSENNYGLVFYISLDGPQKIHDTFRRQAGAFQLTVESIKKLIKIGCDVRINTSIGRHNIKEMSNFINFVKMEFGVYHRVVMVEPIGRANAKMTISANEFANLLRENRYTFEFLDNHDSIVDWLTPACGIGSSMLFIDAYGNVSFCPTLTQKENPEFLAGNIFISSVKNIWENSLIFKKFRGIQCREVERCQFRELCKGGCRSRAFLGTGDINSPDPPMCLLYNSK